jgi:methenyltetrahydrofolate cyclohydrolase
VHSEGHRTESLSSLIVGELNEATAAKEPTPGGGSIAAIVAALAGALAQMTAQYSQRADADSLDFEREIALAGTLQTQAMELADRDVAAYGDYRHAAAMPRDPDPEPRRAAMRTALDASAEVPLALAHVARQIARLGEELASSGARTMRSDAYATTALAAAATSSAAVLVRENLTGRADDSRIATAAQLAAGASASAQRVLDEILRTSAAAR